MMRKFPKVDPVNDRDLTFHELIDECTHLAPGARLSYQLRNKLERYPMEIRRDIVNRTKVGCTPLFMACKKGQTEIAEYLITVCSADIEQRGMFEVQEDRSTHVVSPLWCAAVSGKLPVVELLVRHGADVNAISDTGSTPVRSACFMSFIDIVKFLVAHGADINKSNYNGGTCLINSVQSSQLCEFLLAHGAIVDARDIQNKTALHYAIQEHRIETTKLLLRHGASFTAKSRYGDDALQTAGLKSATRIFEFLTANIRYPPERLANGHELMGATFLDEHNDVQVALLHWKKAIAIRQQYNLFPKQPVMTPQEGYRYQKEFTSLEDLEHISGDLDLVRIQSLLIAERILGPQHKDTIFRLMYRGAAYADVMLYQRCIDLWRRALQIRIEKDSILYTDTCFTAHALVRLMIDYNVRSTLNKEDNIRQRFRDTECTFRLLTNNIVEMRQLLLIRPIYRRQTDFFDKILKCVTHLIYLMLETASTDEAKLLVRQMIATFVKKNVRGVIVEDSILHLCVSKLNTIRSSYFIEEEPIVVFPRENVIRCLLECGADVNAKNEQGITPLHIATLPYNYSDWLVELLLQYGAHIDQPNALGKTPCDALIELGKQGSSAIHVLDHIKLKCLCATVISKHRISYKNVIPKTLESFVQLHEP